jgi:STE24 endopeptidase
VILGDTLLENFSADEIDVIFAHEIGHHIHRHVTKLIATGLLYSLIGFWICDQILAVWVQRIDGQLVYSQLPVHTLPLLTLVTTLFFMAVEPLQNGVSRYFERQADRFALQRTENPAAYRSAFVKLARLNKADPDPHPWEVFLFHSHPPIRQRLATAGLHPGQH